MAVGFFSGQCIRRMYTIHMNSKNKQTIISTIILVVTGVIGAVIIRSHPVDTPREMQSNTQGKIDINVVCQSALSYITFENAAQADMFVDECVQGKYPEIVEEFKLQMNVGNGAAI